MMIIISKQKPDKQYLGSFKNAYVISKKVRLYCETRAKYENFSPDTTENAERGYAPCTNSNKLWVWFHRSRRSIALLVFCKNSNNCMMARSRVRGNCNKYHIEAEVVCLLSYREALGFVELHQCFIR